MLDNLTHSLDNYLRAKTSADAVKQCSECGETKPISDFYLTSDRKRPRAKCKVCHRAECRERWHNDATLRERNYDGWLRRTYGICLDEYNVLAESQSWVCAICGHEPKVRYADKGRYAHRLHLDHCHETGRVRGLLCFNCNRRISAFERTGPWLSQAIAYLQIPPAALDVPPSDLVKEE